MSTIFHAGGKIVAASEKAYGDIPLPKKANGADAANPPITKLGYFILNQVVNIPY